MAELLGRFEINCDMGEGFGYWKLGPDEELMPLIDRANIACGYHAGDHTIMRKSVALAKKYGVKVGSHPGFQGEFHKASSASDVLEDCWLTTGRSQGAGKGANGCFCRGDL